MPKCISIAAYLSGNAVENRYWRATDPIKRSHFQLIWLLAQGKPVHTVAEVTGDSRELERGYSLVATIKEGRRPSQISANSIERPLLSFPKSNRSSYKRFWSKPLLITAYRQVGRWRFGLASRQGERFTSNVGGILSSALILLYSFHVLIIIRPRIASKKHLNKTYHSRCPTYQQEHPQALVELWCMDKYRVV